MKSRPILFSGPMIRALIDGSKTQTRRALRDQNPVDLGAFKYGGHLSRRPVFDKVAKAVVGHRLASVHCPYGEPGDQLWGRETFFAWGRWETIFSEKKGRDKWHFMDMTSTCDINYLYASDGISDTGMFIKRRGGVEPMYWKRPAIFMPRDACRINLEIASIRVERLQDISEADAIAEGITEAAVDHFLMMVEAMGQIEPNPARELYKELWESINGSGSWAINPWVWRIEFRRLP